MLHWIGEEFGMITLCSWRGSTGGPL